MSETSIRSPSNYTITPLGGSNIFIGQYDNVLQYSTAIITCIGSTNMELTLFQTVDKKTIKESTYAIVANVQKEIILDLKYPFIKSTLRNLNVGAQTYLNFEILYREVSVSTSETVASAVNISDSTGLPIVSIDGSLQVDVGNFPATQVVSGTVDVGNFPATQAVSGTVDVGNFPATQAVSGTVDVSNFPATQVVSGTVDVGNFPATQAVSGTVDVGNFPATQVVSGTVDVGNFPATQVVSGTVIVSELPDLSGLAVNVENFPATQVVSGTVDVGNFPATQVVSGTVDVGNFPATQVVSGTVDISGQSVVVSGAVDISGQTVDVGNFPATQVVSGTVDISGQTVNISNQVVNSNTRDGSGNNITSTSGGLDVNIKTNPVIVKDKPTYSLSLTGLGRISQTIRSSAGCLNSFYIANIGGSSSAFIKFYNSSSAVAGDIPLMTIALHKDTQVYINASNMNFSAGLCVRAVDAFDNANDVSASGQVSITCFLSGYSE
jgi:hypothetical protein